eukprot:scaffold2489_cov110-Isochrysis_galbana.AAC.5
MLLLSTHQRSNASRCRSVACDAAAWRVESRNCMQRGQREPCQWALRRCASAVGTSTLGQSPGAGGLSQRSQSSGIGG